VTALRKTILLYFFMTVLLTVLSYVYLDRDLALYFHSHEDPHVKAFFSFLTTFGNSAWYFVPSLILWVYFRKVHKAKEALMAKYIFVTNLVAGVLVWLFKVPFGRARPKLFFEDHLYGFQWFEVTPKLVSFPSGHTITVISTAVALSLLFPKWKYVFLPLGAIIAFSRVVVTAHYMSDVIFASFLGTMVALLLYLHYFKRQDS